MEILIGLSLALVTVVFARVVGFERERMFFPFVLNVIASYYILFAAMTTSSSPLLPEIGWAAVFFGISVAGYKRDLWLVVVGLVAHGMFDFIHDYMIVNTGVPQFWPLFCSAFDLFLAGYLAILLIGRRAPGPVPDGRLTGS